MLSAPIYPSRVANSLTVVLGQEGPCALERVQEAQGVTVAAHLLSIYGNTILPEFVRSL
jgi:hypothetical protein